MAFHTFECKYPLSGSKFATIHKELKNLGSSYFENKPKMADENKYNYVVVFHCKIFHKRQIDF